MSGNGQAILDSRALAAEVGKSRQVGGDGGAILKSGASGQVSGDGGAILDFRFLAAELNKSMQI